ncbi:guanyl-specific ribonuclease [Nocardia sp. X0981]
MRAKIVKIVSALGAAAVAVVVALLSVQGGGGDPGVSSAAPVSGGSLAPAPVSGRAAPVTAAPEVSKVAGVPDRAYRTLVEIDAGRWPDSANAPGTKGGIVFRNREGRLPATDAAGKAIEYREWDVNPKRPGRSRDAERIVTGSDGSAWYTGDHYDTFTRMR